MPTMQNDEKQKPSPERDGSDNNRPLDSQWARSVLSSVSAILKKHAEILAFYEAKNLKQKSHDVSRIVGRNGKICTIYKIHNKNNNEQKGYDKNTKLS
jgi:hypothetical protein